MTKTSTKIVFFGSGPVAAQSLNLLAEDFIIEAVITKPKPDYHRGTFPVIELATKLGIRQLYVRDKAELNKLFGSSPVNSKLAVLIDFGIIISQQIIDYFPLGIINSHFSILPEWRGADPITFTILSGQKQTGVSLMLLVEKMDEGPLLAYREFDIPEGITTPELTDSLIKLSYDLLKKELPSYLADKVEANISQTATGREVSYSRKLTKQDGLIDWHKPALQIEREIRAYLEWPRSRTTLGGKEVIITKVHVMPTQGSDGKPGTIEVIKEKGVLMVTTGNGSLSIQRLQPAGKREMTAQEFLAGYGQAL